MPSLTYAGEPGRVYPSLGLEPVPGESYDVAVDPEDGRWTAASSPTFTPKPSVTAENTNPTTEA